VGATQRRPLAEDTPFEIEHLQIQIWRAMTPDRKAHLVASMCTGIQDAAVEGIKMRYPGAGSREQFLRLAILRLGYDLAVEAFPDARGLSR
jgi:hypothetical protein